MISCAVEANEKRFRLDEALAHHRCGRLDQARVLYERTIDLDPECADAYHLLGVLTGHEGDSAGALELIDRAVALFPRNADFLRSRALTLRQLGRNDEAVTAFASAAELQPDSPAILAGLAATLTDLGNPDDAISLLGEALQRMPARDSLHVELGRALERRGRLGEAARHYGIVLELNPRNAIARNNLGVVYERSGEIEKAIEAYRLAAADESGFGTARRNLGAALLRLQRFDEAAAYLAQVLERVPDSAEAWNTLGMAEHGRNRLNKAETCYRRAIELAPDYAGAWSNLGCLLADDECRGEAEYFFRKAISLDPACADALNGLRSMLVCKGDDDGALAAAEKLLSLQPDHPHGRFFLARMMLLNGAWDEGFHEYAWRPSRAALSATLPPGCALAKALPEELAGKTLNLVREQGLGDELFFLRFAPMLKARGVRLRYFAQGQLVSVLARCGGLDEVLPGERIAPEAGPLISLCDVPALLGFRDEPPAPLPLEPLPARRAAMAARLSALGPPPYHAVTWRAGFRRDAQQDVLVRSLAKNVPLDVLALRLPTGGTVVSIQRHPAGGETARLSALLGRPVGDMSDCNEDLEDMLALLALVDSYHAVSNTNLHLLVGVGGTATVFVPHPPEWRWMAGGETSPWFPGCRIVRQQADGRWPAPE